MRKDQHLGHVLVDDRASHNGVIEDDIVGCNHCQRAMIMREWRKKGGWCSVCDAHVCHMCAEKTKQEGCLPWRKRVDEHLEDMCRRKQNTRNMGL